LDYFHVPLVFLHGAFAAPEDTGYLNPHRLLADTYPFAFLVSDLASASSRVATIEAALSLPGQQGVLALMALRDELTAVRSSLVPPDGLPTLASVIIPQKGIPIETRRKWLQAGRWLQQTYLFTSLSTAEAAVLGTFMERVSVDSGAPIVQQGDSSSDLYLIEAGEAEVQLVTPVGNRMSLALLGPGEYFGEIAMVTGGERTADVIAKTPMRLMKLTREAFMRFLAHEVEVENQLVRTTLKRVMETGHTMSAEREHGA
jgi:hypothetical protein